MSSFTPGRANKTNSKKKPLCLYLDGVLLTALLTQANEGDTKIGQELPKATKCPATTSRTKPAHGAVPEQRYTQNIAA